MAMQVLEARYYYTYQTCQHPEEVRHASRIADSARPFSQCKKGQVTKRACCQHFVMCEDGKKVVMVVGGWGGGGGPACSTSLSLCRTEIHCLFMVQDNFALKFMLLQMVSCYR